jgi:hypothetical protein
MATAAPTRAVSVMPRVGISSLKKWRVAGRRIAATYRPIRAKHMVPMAVRRLRLPPSIS